MAKSKSHHYVPQFYLARFADSQGKLWVFDKATGRTYQTSTANTACVNQFYTLPELEEFGLDPLTLEHQFSVVERETARITDCWFWQLEETGRVVMPEINKDVVSHFIVLQMQRTVEARVHLVQTLRSIESIDGYRFPGLNTSMDERALHSRLLWHDELINRATDLIKDRVWIFGRNTSSTRFYTSDHPVLIKTGDNAGWAMDKLYIRSLLGEELYDPTTYFVYPLSPEWILYCHHRDQYPLLAQFDNQVSPAPFTSGFVDHENSGQVGVSHRFVYSCDDDFEFARGFISGQPWVRDYKRDRFEEPPYPFIGEGWA